MISKAAPHRPLILASASPRRIEIFESHGLDPAVHPSAYQETVPFEMPPAERAMFFAMGKALAVRNALQEQAAAPEQATAPVLIGADTIVVHQGSIMEKPKDKEDGMQMLMALSGETHQVITGVCLADLSNRLTRCFYEVSDVTFVQYPESDMDVYLDTDEAYDKAGGYGIQGTFSRYVSDVHGDVDNIIGFPFARFMSELDIYEQILKNGRL